MSNAELMDRRNAALPRGLASLTSVFVAKAENAELWDVEGKRYIDFAAGIAVCNTGHRHPKIMAATARQSDAFVHTAFQINPYEIYVSLAERLNRLAPIKDAKTIFLNSGAEAVENAIKLMDLADDINWVMVVQGYTADEYLYCVDKIKDQGLITPLMAIGSLCTRKKIAQARKIILTVRENLPSTVDLHGFGVDFRFLRDLAIFKALYSTDTAAWKWNNRSHWEADWQPRGFLPKSELDKLKNFEKYKSKINRLLSEYSKQKKLFEY